MKIMSGRITKLKLIIYFQLTLVYIAVAFASIGVFYFVTPQQYFAVYPSIDVFYWLFGMILTFFLDRSRMQHPDKLLNVFMMCRIIKFICIVVFLIIGIRVMGLNRTTFTVSLMSNYFVYSAMEIYIYYRFNKRITGK